MTFKLVIFFLFSWVNLLFAQEIQIRMKTKSYFDAPVIGKINLYQTTVLAKNQKNTYETANIEKRFFGFLAGLFSDINDTTGHLITDDGRQWEYNINEREYWIYTDDDEALKPDDEKESKKISFTVGNENSEILSISRISSERIDDIHGFKAKKSDRGVIEDTEPASLSSGGVVGPACQVSADPFTQCRRRRRERPPDRCADALKERLTPGEPNATDHGLRESVVEKCVDILGVVSFFYQVRFEPWRWEHSGILNDLFRPDKISDHAVLLHLKTMPVR